MNEKNSMQKIEKPTILVVDDDDAGRYTTVRVIRKEGFPVMEAATGEEALKRAAENPDLIVLDINLPDISGFEVCRKVKENQATAHIPILHLSARYLDNGARVKGLNIGADAYLTQPVDPSVLVATINALLRMKRAEEKMVDQLQELQRWHNVMLDREDRVMELKREVNELLARAGRPPRYPSAMEKDEGGMMNEGKAGKSDEK